MTKKVIADDLVKVVSKVDRKEVLTILAWGDEVELVDESDSSFREIKTFWYKDVGDTNFEKIEVNGLIKKVVKLADVGKIKVLAVSFVDVQQGDGICIETPKRRKILIDGGDNPMFARYLAQRYVEVGSTKQKPLIVDAIVVTHGDADHFAGLTEIYESQTHPKRRKQLFLRPLRIFHNGIVKGPSKKDGHVVPDTEILGRTELNGGKLYLSELVDDLLTVQPDRLNSPFKSWIKAIKGWKSNGQISDPLKIKRLQFGNDAEFSFLADEGISITVLGPFTEKINGSPALRMLGEPSKSIALEMSEEAGAAAKGYSASHTINGHSIVLQMKYGNVRFLFTGDLNQESSMEILKRVHNEGLHLESEVFKVPHHGSADFSHSFIERVRPVISVISSGDESAKKEYIHPRATVVGSLGKYSRVPRPLIFVTEMVAFFEKIGYSELIDAEASSHKKGYKYYGFRRASFGIVHVRTDGKKVLVYTHSGKRDMKEAYAFEVKDDGDIKTIEIVKR